MNDTILKWTIFIFIIFILIIIDFNTHPPQGSSTTFRNNMLKSLFYIVVALLFAGGLYLNGENTQEFLTGYLVEKSLAVDNIVIISLVFQQFSIHASLLQNFPSR